MKQVSATFTSQGIVLPPISGECIDRVMGCLADGPDLLADWEKGHRAEAKHER